ncbi:MAG: aldehyde dehydrogenase [Deltaproteobacteria bacterium]|nr:aldehyde dehydrogenase [Deltaproteobacteria bacterium]
MAKMFIAGEWAESASGMTYEVRNPATGELVDTVPKGTAEDARRAIDAAADAFKGWRETSAEERSRLMQKGVELVQGEIKGLSELLTREQGKPVGDSEREIEHFLHGLLFYAGLASKVRGAQVPLPQKGMQGFVIKQPLGVCGAIVPWNFPITLMGPGGVVGEELLRNPKVRRLAFTGETATGRHVMEVAGRDLKRVTLELGGSDPMIVCDDADLDRAVTGASVGRFYNCGQACLAVKRLFVFESIADVFIDKLIEKVKRLKVGNGLNPDTRLGPLHTAAQRKEIEEQVEDALTRGAKLLIGGKRPEGAELDKGYFYLPTLLANVPEESRAVQEETFGPLLPIFRVRDLDEAIEKANSSPYGLGSSIWTRSMPNAYKAIERLEAGNVWVNSLHIGYDELPFGGVKASGIGREHGPEALDYYFEPKGVAIAL